MRRLTPSSRGSSATSSTSSRISVRPQPRPRGLASRGCRGRQRGERPAPVLDPHQEPPAADREHEAHPPVGDAGVLEGVDAGLDDGHLEPAGHHGVDREILGELLEGARRDQFDVGDPRDDHLDLEGRLRAARPDPAGAGPPPPRAGRASASSCGHVEVESRSRAAAARRRRRAAPRESPSARPASTGSSPAICSAATSRSNCSSCSAPPAPPGSRRATQATSASGVPASARSAQASASTSRPGSDTPLPTRPEATETTCGSVMTSLARPARRSAPRRARDAKSRGVEEVRRHLLPGPGAENPAQGGANSLAPEPAPDRRGGAHLLGRERRDNGRRRHAAEFAPVERLNDVVEHGVLVDDDAGAADADHAGPREPRERRLDVGLRLEHAAPRACPRRGSPPLRAGSRSGSRGRSPGCAGRGWRGRAARPNTAPVRPRTPPRPPPGRRRARRCPARRRAPGPAPRGRTAIRPTRRPGPRSPAPPSSRPAVRARCLASLEAASTESGPSRSKVTSEADASPENPRHQRTRSRASPARARSARRSPPPARGGPPARRRDSPTSSRRQSTRVPVSAASRCGTSAARASAAGPRARRLEPGQRLRQQHPAVPPGRAQALGEVRGRQGTGEQRRVAPPERQRLQRQGRDEIAAERRRDPPTSRGKRVPEREDLPFAKEPAVPLPQQLGLPRPRAGAEDAAAPLAAGERPRLAPEQPQLLDPAEESLRLERAGNDRAGLSHGAPPRSSPPSACTSPS